MIKLTTDRLIMRPITVQDAENLYLLNLNPEVIRYTADPPFESIDHSRKFCATYDQYQKYKMGRFSTFLKSDGNFIGWCGLKYHENGEVDLGYRILQDYWGNGYATESSIASLEYGFRQLSLKEIVAYAMKNNTTSIKVMQKLGMSYASDIKLEGIDGVQYVIKREQFYAANS